MAKQTAGSRFRATLAADFEAVGDKNLGSGP
jgi:hypothetical protein